MYRRFPALIIIIALIIQISLPATVSAGLFSVEQEIKMGKEAAQQLEKHYGLVDDPALQERVARIGAQLALTTGRPELPYSFKVLKAKDVNALSLPGGYIYLFQGLTDYMKTDEELAGVLGHELAHAVKRHAVRQTEKNMGAGLLMALLLGDKAAPLQSLVQQMLAARYSQDDERESDYYGYIYSTKAGYNPYSMIMGLEKLGELHDAPDYGMFSSHPDAQDRIGRLKGYLEKDKVHPQVVSDSQSACVVDGTWQLVPITAALDGYGPRYRAYLTAGALAKLARQPDLSGDRFILDNDDEKVTIWYDDIKVAVISGQDGVFAGTTPLDLADTYVRKLKEWAERQKQAL